MLHSQKYYERDYLALREDGEDEDRYLRWEDLHLDDVEAPSLTVLSSDAFHEFFAALIATSLALLLWFRESLFVPMKRTIGRFFSTRAPLPVQARTPSANKKLTKNQNKRDSASVKETHKNVSLIMDRLKGCMRSPEFWLGILFGVATRLATKVAILTAFPPTQKISATVISVVACAVAGLSAGIVVHFVRTSYRNSKAAPGEEKQKYWSRALLESALTGLFGGIIGGGATNAGVMIVNTSSFAIGATAGGVAGVLHAGVKGYLKSRGQKTGMNWGQLAFQGVALGAVGGVIGGISSDIVGATDSVAAPTGEAGDVIYTGPASSQYMQDPCGYSCGALHIVQPAPVIEPIRTVPVGQPAATPPVEVHAEHPIQKPIHHTTHHHHHHKPVQTQKPSHQVAKDPCHQVVKPKHVKHIKHLKHIKHIIHHEPVTPTIIQQQPLAPPPQIMMPILGPATLPVVPMTPIDPCASEACEVPCRASQVIIKGPCADPGVACIERVSFNESGDATKVVLEQSAGHEITKPHFEVSPSKVTTDGPYWNKTVQGTASAESPAAGSGELKVSLVMPFVHPGYAQLANANPIPA